MAAADAAAARALIDAPDDAELLHIRGCARLQLGDVGQAKDLLAHALALVPRHPVFSYNYGNACGAAGDFAAAARAMFAATSEPSLAADAWFKTGTALGQSHIWHAAAAAMLIAARTDPNHADAMMGVAACALQLTRKGEFAAGRARALPAEGTLSFVVCSIRPEKVDRLRARLQQLLAVGSWELITITDARSLCEGYNRGIAASRGELLVLCHDDILLLADDFEQRLRSCLAEFELIGVAGASRIDGPSWTWSGPPHIHCWIAHLDEQGRPVMLLLGAQGPVVSGACVLDGVFMAGRRAVFERIGFDSDTFDGFHLYDIDFSYRASLAGVRSAVCLDLGVLHESDGRYDRIWQDYAARFLNKFSGRVWPRRAKLNLGRAVLDSTEQLVALQDWLAHWTARPDAELRRAVQTAVEAL
jgi:hypothetical protein